jgi:hypothetical protein
MSCDIPLSRTPLFRLNGFRSWRAASNSPGRPKASTATWRPRLAGWTAHTRKRSDAVRTRIDKAIKALRREHADITISSVARRAGVTRKSIHHRKDLLAQIRAHRPLTAITDDITAPTPDNDTSIIAALRARLTAKDTQISELKATLREREQTIAVLHGQLDKLHDARN